MKVLDSGETFYQWFADQFNRSGATRAAFVPFQPLPPDAPVYSAPVNGAVGVPLSVTLRWQGGYWAHKYDIYFGTTPTPPRIATDVVVGGVANNVVETYTRQNLVTRHHVLLARRRQDDGERTASGSTWSFTTAASSGGTATDVVMYAGRAPTLAGTWQVVSDSTAAGGSRMYQPDKGAAKVASPSASPANYFDLAFNAQAGVPYHIWIRGRAQNDSTNNDSVWLQFTNTVDESGTRRVAHRLDERHLRQHRGVLRVRCSGLGLARQRMGHWCTRHSNLLRHYWSAACPGAAAGGRDLARSDCPLALDVSEHRTGILEERCHHSSGSRRGRAEP